MSLLSDSRVHSLEFHEPHQICRCPGGLSQYRISLQIHIQLKSHESLYAHILSLNCQIILKLCTEHGSITAVLCANCWNDLTTEMDVLDELVFTRFEFMMRFGSYIATAPKVHFHIHHTICVLISFVFSTFIFKIFIGTKSQNGNQDFQNAFENIISMMSSIFAFSLTWIDFVIPAWTGNCVHY